MGEECDDGNLEAGDGCSPTCQAADPCFYALGPGRSGAQVVAYSIDAAGALSTIGTLDTAGGFGAGALGIPPSNSLTTCGEFLFAMTASNVFRTRISGSTFSAPVATAVSAIGIACSLDGSLLYVAEGATSAVDLSAYPVASDGTLGTPESVTLPVPMASETVFLQPTETGSLNVYVLRAVSLGSALTSTAFGVAVTAGVPTIASTTSIDALIVGAAEVDTRTVLTTIEGSGAAPPSACVAIYPTSPTMPGSMPASAECASGAMSIFFGAAPAADGSLVYLGGSDGAYTASLMGTTVGTPVRTPYVMLPSITNLGVALSADGQYVATHTGEDLFVFEVGATPAALTQTDSIMVPPLVSLITGECAL